MTGNDTVETAVYEREDEHRIIYAVNTDWWSKDEPDTTAILKLAGMEYRIFVPRDVITQVTMRDDIAVVTSDIETEVLQICPREDGFILWIQGGEKAKFRVYSPKELTIEGMSLVQEKGAYLIDACLQGKAVFHFRQKDKRNR
jgi:hypothetical protein